MKFIGYLSLVFVSGLEFLGGHHKGAVGKCLKKNSLTIEAKHPFLELCYTTSNLYRSDLEDVCSLFCRGATVAASKEITSKCKTKFPTFKNPLAKSPELVYSVWGDEEGVRAACARHGRGGRRCLDEFTRTARILNTDKDRSSVSKVCTTCSHELYDLFKTKAQRMPMLLDYTIDTPNIAFQTLGRVCKWH